MKYFIIMISMLISLTTNAADHVEFFKMINVENGQTIHEKLPYNLATPASISKIPMAYIALNKFGRDFQFKTQLLSQFSPNNGELKSDLIIKFDGNPDLKFTEIENVFQALKIRKIKGKIIIDDSEFDQKFYPTGYDIGDLNMCYGAPISSIIMNKNCFNADLKISKSVIKVKRLEKHHPIIKNNSKIITEKSYCELELKSNNKNNYEIYGCHKQGNLLHNLKIAYQNPRDMIEKAIRKICKKHHIKHGKIIFNKKYDQTKQKVIKEIASRPLTQLVHEMLHRSDNLIANVLFKKLNISKNETARWNGAKETFHDFFEKENLIKKRGMLFFDGAGLSTKNLISVDSMVNILFAIFQNNKMRKEFIGFLPKYGPNIATSKMFKNLPDNYEIIAKTGFLSHNTASLAGYVTKNGEIKYIFCQILNNFNEDYKNIRKIQQAKILHILREAERKNAKAL